MATGGMLVFGVFVCGVVLGGIVLGVVIDGPATGGTLSAAVVEIGAATGVGAAAPACKPAVGGAAGGGTMVETAFGAGDTGCTAEAGSSPPNVWPKTIQRAQPESASTAGTTNTMSLRIATDPLKIRT